MIEWTGVLIGAGAYALLQVGWWAWRRRRSGWDPTRECERCGVGLRHGFVVYVTLDNNIEIDEVAANGGTGMAAYFCRAHRPVGAVPWRP